MKLLCIQDHWPSKEVGLFKKRIEPKQKIHGLTKGKVYEAAAVFDPMFGGNVGLQVTFKWLVFNDAEEWESYQLNLFEPVESPESAP